MENNTNVNTNTNKNRNTNVNSNTNVNTNTNTNHHMLMMMKIRGGDHGGANNKSWEMFQEPMPYRALCPLPLFLHITISLQYNISTYIQCNTIPLQYFIFPRKYKCNTIQLHTVRWNSKVPPCHTHSNTICGLSTVHIHYFFIIECNSFPMQYNWARVSDIIHRFWELVYQARAAMNSAKM